MYSSCSRPPQRVDNNNKLQCYPKIISAKSCVTLNDIQHYAAENATSDYYFAFTYRKNIKQKNKYLKNRPA